MAVSAGLVDHLYAPALVTWAAIAVSVIMTGWRSARGFEWGVCDVEDVNAESGRQIWSCCRDVSVSRRDDGVQRVYSNNGLT